MNRYGLYLLALTGALLSGCDKNPESSVGMGSTPANAQRGGIVVSTGTTPVVPSTGTVIPSTGTVPVVPSTGTVPVVPSTGTVGWPLPWPSTGPVPGPFPSTGTYH